MSSYHCTGASFPRSHKPSPGPLTVNERAEIIDRLSAGSAPRACLVRKLLRLHDEQRSELKALKGPETMPVSGV